MPAPASTLCTVTHTFYDASGTEVEGVLVRFTPASTPQRAHALGFVATEITAESNASGVVSFSLFREMKGTLTITGVAVTRQVTVPDLPSVDLYDLLGGLPDPLDPIDLPFTSPPRRS